MFSNAKTSEQTQVLLNNVTDPTFYCLMQNVNKYTALHFNKTI